VGVVLLCSYGCGKPRVKSIDNVPRFFYVLPNHMKHDYLQQLLHFLGFSPSNGNNSQYSKTYANHHYTISVDFEKEKIDYPDPMTLGDRTTSNFEASENFVVLECVNQLLEKGYKPESITLEKKWGLGHREKGKVDIFVTYPKSNKETSEKAFLLVECKTWGKEFEHEFEKTQTNGGQLLSYYVQEPETRLLCLYASVFQNGKLRYTNRIIETHDNFKGKNKADIHKIWKDGNEQIVGQSFKYDGIFDEEATPYNVTLKPLKRKNLVALQQGDSGYIYNQFAEILRHNVVSDKPNAFNKMFNLILAKIVDEDRPDDEELAFQWRDGDTDIELQKRLNDLYKKGMFEYLHKTVTDFSDDELNIILKDLSKTVQNSLRERITELRLHKNNEFAFKEVFDETSFIDNAKVVREAAILLQNFQLRYSHKQQFLSNFFELLLSNTLKQEAGQFFTPVPVAKFILSSLPLQEIIEQKIKNRDPNFLPTVIDYAAGSGHFLTEAMDEIQQIVQQIDPKNCTQSIKSNLEHWQTESQAYQWAGKFIYGIEKDYRLSKIAKVSCFLNGDGLANIIHADGLDTFDSEAYQDAPLLHLKKHTKDNPKFDILVANPPYSVSAFIKTLARGRESFDMYDAFTEQGKEIECLFIERTKQLVKENGLVGIVLPSSILNNTGVYTLARAIILKYFKIVSIVEFGSATFMATGTNTITLFLKRRKDSHFKIIEDHIQQFFRDGNDAVCNGIENAFTQYVQHVYKIELTDYVSFAQQQSNEQIEATELYQDYQKQYEGLAETKNLKDKIGKLTQEITNLQTKAADEKTTNKITETAATLAKAERDLVRLFYEKTVAIEQQKMLYFMLAYPQEIVLIKTNPAGNNDQEKDFLGYEFSSRRGHEGIKMFADAAGNHSTKLYSDSNKKDPTKASSYVYAAFLGNMQPVHESLSEHIQTKRLYEMMKFDRVAFEKEINISFKKKALTEIESKWELVRLREVADIQKGKSITQKDTQNGNIKVVAGGIDFAYLHNESNRPSNTITISASGANAGYVNFWKEPIFASDCTTIIGNSDNLTAYILYFLKSIQADIFNLARGAAQPHVYPNDIANLKIPLPPKAVQEQIVEEILAIEVLENEGIERLVELANEIESIVDNIYLSDYHIEKLGAISEIFSGGTPNSEIRE
jgi:type I restriction enzyme M protein